MQRLSSRQRAISVGPGHPLEPQAWRPGHGPPPASQWDVRFGTKEAGTGWEELCRYALANTRRCLEVLQAEPRRGADTDH